MNINEAKKQAIKLFKIHGLTDWTFSFDESVSRFGCCSYRKKTISISKHLTKLNTHEQVTDTILHEIAHALIPSGYGHNEVWKQKALSIGCNGSRIYNSNEVIQPSKRYIVTCQNCNYTYKCYRRTKNVACGNCCKKYNHGKFTKKYLFKFTKI